jgi:hypothetical protein
MWTLLIELVLLTVAYWLADLAVRRDGVLRLFEGLRLRGWALPAVGFGAFLAAPFATWDLVPQGDALRLLATVLALALAWKASTKDVDPVVGERRSAARVGVVVMALFVVASPAFLLPTLMLLTTPFGLWQHHATLPMRMAQAVLAFLGLLLLAPALPAPTLLPAPLLQTAAPLIWFLLTIQISHYLITAIAKAWLGPYPWSWVVDNRMHHLAAGAYSWGWARFVGWSRWRRVVAAVKVLERPMQLVAFSVEALAPLALLGPEWAVAFCVLWAGFHLGVFAVSGLLFWDWVLADLAMAGAVWLLPAEVGAQAFGGLQLLACLVFLVVFPLRHKLWRPMPLGWWDTPFTQRVHWRVRGVSGKEYTVTNDFMCPHERVYGKVHGCFHAPRPVCTYHLGEVWKHDLRDALREAGPDLERLSRVRERFGILPRSEAWEAHHRAYLTAFFEQINRGYEKRVLPRGLRWLKAPGGQIFYWTDGEKFAAQEPVDRVRLVYREEYFDGEELVRLCEEEVEAFDVNPVPPPLEAPVGLRERTPKEMDDFLLGFAAGRLIDLPSFGDGFVRTDDGKTR